MEVIDGVKSMNMSTFVRVLFIGAMLATGITGCKRDPALYQLNWMKEKAVKNGQDLKEQRVELALSKWQNGRLDSEPILLSAALGKPVGRETGRLSFYTFDEDKDIVGFGIVEEYTDSNGSRTTLTEEYETTEKRQYPRDEAVQSFIVRVEIRDAGQRKDEQRWNEYLEAKPDDVDARGDLAPAGETLPAMPPIWISIPEPNHVDVRIYTYDQQGHKSQPFRVVNFIPRDESIGGN